jgi:hypothetical protein
MAGIQPAKDKRPFLGVRPAFAGIFQQRIAD